MRRISRFVLYFILIFVSCTETPAKVGKNKSDSIGDSSIDTATFASSSYINEQRYKRRKKILCSQLSLYDIENLTGNFELRVWLIPSMWDPSILYILKQTKKTWVLYHYQFYTLRATKSSQYYDSPAVDSVEMEPVRPQNETWNRYIRNLMLDSLWNLQTESSIIGKKFEVVDGYRYILEFNDKGKYKYLFYTAPDYFQDKDINHKKFTEFKKLLVDPIIYRGMRNP